MQINISSQNFSIERNFFTWMQEKTRDLARVFLHRVEKYVHQMFRGGKIFVSQIIIVYENYSIPQVSAQRVRKFRKVQAKKLVKSNKSKNIFREIAFLAVLNIFPVQKLIFGHFLKLQKVQLVFS